MIYLFGKCELDTHRYEFRMAGEATQLEPKVFDVLVHLIQNRDRVVTKDELLSHVWSDQYISEGTLNHAIMTARKAIGDDGQRQAVIRTHRGRGYRFVADILATDTAAESAAPDLSDPTGLAAADHAPLNQLDSLSERPPPDWVGPRVRGERKGVTVLSCALANVADLIEMVGPDRVHYILQHVFTAAAAQIRQYDGTIMNIMEGSLLAMFGAPVAYEDHAQRAVLAAVGLQQRLNALSGETEAQVQEELAVRIGLHTGQVFIGSIGAEARLTSTSIDRTTELAVRCQEAAPIGTILVSDATQQLLDDVVQLEPTTVMPGVRPDAILSLYRVVAWQRWRRLLGQPVGRKLSPFVGRHRELSTLQDLLAQAAEGRGQVVGFVADPGMGKSRLLRQFCQGLDKDLVFYLEGHCLSYSTTTPYVPVLDVLRQVWNMAEGDATATIISQVRDGLDQIEMLSDDAMAYVLNLFGIQDETLSVLGGLTPGAIKHRTFALMRQLLVAASRSRPVILAVEDLHWIDATSEEFLAALVEHLAGSAILLVLTYRTGYQPPWMGKSYTTQMALTPLAVADSVQMVQAYLDAATPRELPMTEIVAKAAGNPFFIEELSQDLTEQELTVSISTVPDTIQAVLSARIDRLPTEVEMGMAAMSQGLRDYRAMRSELLAPYMRLMLVEGYQRTRQVEAGLAHLSVAMEQMKQTGEGWSEAELHRLEGSLRLHQEPPDEVAAEACFQLALDVSRRQGAKSLELRATVNLCQLWNRQGKKEASHALLRPLYNWFSEGHDTVDMQAAKAILDV